MDFYNFISLVKVSKKKRILKGFKFWYWMLYYIIKIYKKEDIDINK